MVYFNSFLKILTNAVEIHITVPLTLSVRTLTEASNVTVILAIHMMPRIIFVKVCTILFYFNDLLYVTLYLKFNLFNSKESNLLLRTYLLLKLGNK